MRARGYLAAVAKIEGIDWKKGTAGRRVAELNRIIAMATGIEVDSVEAWATGANAVAA